MIGEPAAEPRREDLHTSRGTGARCTTSSDQFIEWTSFPAPVLVEGLTR